MKIKKIEAKICCPAHAESTPSCVLYKDGTLHCFGCGQDGHWVDEGSTYGIATILGPDGKFKIL